jgi:crotonobetaine/carnitine-CoA ligase
MKAAQLTGHEGQKINLGLLLQNSVEQYGPKPFITQAETSECLTYTEFNQLTNRIAHGLSGLGIGATEYVAIMLPNCVQFLASSYALKKIGAIEVAINNTFRGVSLARTINITKCETLMMSGAYLNQLSDVKGELLYVKRIIMLDDHPSAKKLFSDKEVLPWQGMLSKLDTNFPCEFDDDETAVILFTSGTTGTSKGCEIPHRCSVRVAEAMIEAFDLSENDSVYSPYPLFHCGPTQFDILPALMVGGQAIIRQGFSLSNFWKDMSRYKVTWFCAMGSVQQLLWTQVPCLEENQHNLRFMWGAPLPVDHDDFEARFQLKLVRGGGYGSTEVGCVALPLFNKRGAGKVLDRYEVAIVDERDNILPVGESGELVVREREPKIMASQYIGMPEVSAEAWRNSWFHTGDLAKLDEDGDLFWLARMSERIRVKGEMVSAYEIEEGILSHPVVIECAVIGIPDGIGEELVKAFVTLKENTTLALDELRLFCIPIMSKFMNPTALEILDYMPCTPTGKPAKAELQKRA